jgi:hypothetical protein
MGIYSNIKSIFLHKYTHTHTECENVVWNEVAQNMVHWWALVDMIFLFQ